MRSTHPPRHWRRHLPYLVLLILGTALLTALALLHHRALGTGYDLGIYDQVVWNLAHGRFFATTLVYETNGYYDHFEPILTLIAPLYWLMPNVNVLLVLQSLALALGSLPIYLYAYRRMLRTGAKGSPYLTAVPLLIAAAYLVYPALHSANLNDFHEVALLPPLLGFALYGLLTGQRRVMLIFLALCLMVKEDFGVTALAFSLYIFTLKPTGFRRRDGLWMAAFVLVWVVLVLQVLYPAVTRGMPYPFVDRRYAWLGNSPASALRGLLTQPQVAAEHIFQAPKLVFLFRLFAPLLFLPLLGWPVIALALPILVYLMMSEYQPQWSVQSYYNPPLLPILFFAAIDASFWLAGRVARARIRPRLALTATWVIIAVTVAYGYYVFSPGPGGRDFNPQAFTVSERAAAAQRLIQKIPAEAGVSTVWNVVPYLSQRQRIYTVLARPAQPPEFVLNEVTPGSEGAPTYPYAAPPGWPPVYNEYKLIQEDKPFRLLAHARSIPMTPVAQDDPLPQPLTLGAYAWLDGQDPTQGPILRPGERARLMLAWQRTGRLDRRYVFFVHLLDPSRQGKDGAPVLVTQSGHEAGDGQFPTTFWETWTNPKNVLDEQVLEIPKQTPPGAYQAWAGIYDRETGERIALTPDHGGLIYVGSLEVRP